MTNANKAAIVNVKRLNNSDKAMGRIAQGALNVGVAREVLIGDTLLALTATPSKARFALFSIEYGAGTLASYLEKHDRSQKLRGDKLLAYARTRLTDCAKFGGTGELKKGQIGCRTEIEEAGYTSVRAQKSQLIKAAGVTSPLKSGGDTSKTRAPNRKAAKGKAAKTDAKAAMTPAFKTFEDMLAYCMVQAKAMSTTWNKNAKLSDATGKGRVLALSSAIGDFAAAIAKVAAPAD